MAFEVCLCVFPDTTRHRRYGLWRRHLSRHRRLVLWARPLSPAPPPRVVGPAAISGTAASHYGARRLQIKRFAELDGRLAPRLTVARCRCPLLLPFPLPLPLILPFAHPRFPYPRPRFPRLHFPTPGFPIPPAVNGMEIGLSTAKMACFCGRRLAFCTVYRREGGWRLVFGGGNGWVLSVPWGRSLFRAGTFPGIIALECRQGPIRRGRCRL